MYFFKIYSCSNQKNVAEKAVTINLAKSSKILLERPKIYRINLKERVRCVIVLIKDLILQNYKFAPFYVIDVSEIIKRKPPF